MAGDCDLTKLYDLISKSNGGQTN